VAGTGFIRVMAIISLLATVATGDDLTQLSVEELMNVRYTLVEYGLSGVNPLMGSNLYEHDLGNRTQVSRELTMRKATNQQLPNRAGMHIEIETSDMRFEYEYLKSLTIETKDIGRMNHYSGSGPLLTGQRR
jgi:hypothetical protein